MSWHVLDVRAVWIREFASALSRQVKTLGWLPRFGAAARLQSDEREFDCEDPPLRIREFPLQRGFGRFPFSIITGEGKRIGHRLLERADEPDSSPLVCCSPQYAAVAERWPGPVIYYVTDFFPAYGRAPLSISVLDRRMCRASDLVCVNSERIAQYLIAETSCVDDKIVIIPNATRSANVRHKLPDKPAALPSGISELPRPIAGVVGNLAENIDWLLLRDAIDRTPWLSWLFVGPTDTQIADRKQREARASLYRRQGRVRFVGSKHYSELQEYARALDVAVLPYRKCEPTYSGSSTRFYDHLAACRPMLATRGCAELLQKEPLLKLNDAAEELITELEQLRATQFRDGFEELRWQASQNETWDHRAFQMIAALAERQTRVRGAAA